jgi:hypothetical protein
MAQLVDVVDARLKDLDRDLVRRECRCLKQSVEFFDRRRLIGSQARAQIQEQESSRSAVRQAAGGVDSRLTA